MQDSVVVVEKNGKVYYLIPTAHISSSSVSLVRETIEEVCPESVCIELDEARYESMTQKEQWDERSIFTVIKEKRVALLFVQIILSSYQKRLGAQFNVTSGQEMLEAAALAEKNKCNLVLADRSLRVTFNRVWRKLTFLEKCKLLYGLIEGIFIEQEPLSSAELEALKTRDVVQSALEELSTAFPTVKRYLVDERDLYLSAHIKNAPGQRVVAVLGAAHLQGVIRTIEQDTIDVDVQQLSREFEKTPLQKISGWIFPVMLVVLVIFTFHLDASLAKEQIVQWVLYNGLLSGAFSLLGGAHILSALTAVVAAPITSLNPLLAAGWFAGLVEAFLRKPAVKDFANLTQDASSFRGLRRNPVTRVLLVVILANIGSTLGTILASYGIVKIFMRLL